MALPIGYNDFDAIIEKELDSIDKTLFIKEILDNKGRSTAICLIVQNYMRNNMANPIILFIDTHRRRVIELFVYAICIAALITLILLGTPELLAMIMVSLGSALVGWGMLLLVGIFLGYLFNEIIFSLLEKYRKVFSLPESQLRLNAEVSSVSSEVLLPKPTPRQEKVPIERLINVGTDKIQRFHFGTSIRTFEHHPFVLVKGEHMDLLHLERDEKKKTLKASLVIFPEQKEKKRSISSLGRKEVEILLPPKKPWDANAWSSFDSKTKQEEELVTQLSSLPERNENLGIIELSDGHLIPKGSHSDCDLILPLAANHYITVLNNKAGSRSATLTQWELKGGAPIYIDSETLKENIISLIYLEDNLLASIEESKKEAKIQIWKLGSYSNRKTILTVGDSEYNDDNPLRLLALSKTHFLSFGGRHGIKLWKPAQRKNSSEKQLPEFKARFLKRPDFWKPSFNERYNPLAYDGYIQNHESHYMRLVLLKHNYLACAYLGFSGKSEIKIFNLDDKETPLTPVKIISYRSPYSIETWKEFLFISYPGDNNFFIYNMDELMKGKSEAQHKRLMDLLRPFISDPSKIVLEYCDDDFDRIPKDCVHNQLMLF